jgi:iron(III) transport system permease protein
MSGASSFKTLTRVILPLLAPAILIVTLLGLIQSLEAFEVELVLGAPAGIDVFSTKIYRLMREQPPAYGSATALSMLILLLVTPLIIAQQRLVERRSYVTVTGKFGARVHALGAWKWPAFAVVAGLVITMTVVPSLFVILGSFMKIFGAFEVRNPWTLQNWTTVLQNPGFVSSLTTTITLAVSAAVVSMVVFAVLAYITARTTFAGRGALDFLTWVPSLLPGIVISLGFLWMFLDSPVFRPFYGTTGVLVIAVSLSIMTRSVQMVRAALLQIGSELEQAAWVSGAGWWYTARRVLFPLVAPTLVVVGILAFSSASRTASHVALLATSSNRPLVLLQLDFLADGNFEGSAVIGVVILLMTLGAALLARAFGRKALIGE